LDLTETLTQSDSPVLGFDSSVLLQELMVLIDAQDVDGPTLVQVMSLLDSIVFALTTTISDSLSLTDTVDIVSSNDIVLTETISLSDSIAFTLDYVVTLTESLGMSETIKPYYMEMGLSESLSLADVLALVLTIFSPERPKYNSVIKNTLLFDSKINNAQGFPSEINNELNFDSKVE